MPFFFIEILQYAFGCKSIFSAKYFLLTFLHIYPHLQETNFENILAKGEFVHNEHFLLLSQCFQLYINYKTKFLYKYIFHIFSRLFKISAANLVCDKWLKLCNHNTVK